jgi:SpoVK/Ycf46/Vps4 family AAA+-type ATPase
LDSAVISYFRSSKTSGTRGVLLHGPSGNGKTLLGVELGKFVQTHGLANFLCVRCLDLVSKVVGDTEQNVSKVFQKARDCAPCLVFLDQIDAIAMRRGSGQSETTERTFERVLSVLLVEMDGVMAKETSVLSPHAKVVIIASTTTRAMLDPAITRPGRLGMHVMVGPPQSVDERIDLVKACLRKTPNKLANEFLAHICATKMSHMSSADIAGICRESATLALREDIHTEFVEERHFLKALDAL